MKLLICGGNGFIGRNLVEYFSENPNFQVCSTYHRSEPPAELLKKKNIIFIPADLTQQKDVERVVKGIEVVIQAAATTSGAKEIVTKPYYHVTDNAVMNSLIFRACHSNQVKHVIFFSCTTMYQESTKPVKESDFNYKIIDKYFGVGWTKVYIEKMCEFYSKIGPTKYTAIRHSNIYGPYDKYDLERSHVFGATITKVMTASEKLTVWGDGSEERDLLHVDDLVDFVARAIARQTDQFELVNVGLGKSCSVKNLVEKIIKISGKNLLVVYDKTKPTIPFKLAIDISRARNKFGWNPKIDLDAGIKRTLVWYKENILSKES